MLNLSMFCILKLAVIQTYFNILIFLHIPSLDPQQTSLCVVLYSLDLDRQCCSNLVATYRACRRLILNTSMKIVVIGRLNYLYDIWWKTFKSRQCRWWLMVKNLVFQKPFPQNLSLWCFKTYCWGSFILATYWSLLSLVFGNINIVWIFFYT